MQVNVAASSALFALSRCDPALFRGRDLDDPKVAALVPAQLQFLDRVTAGERCSGAMIAAAGFWRAALHNIRLQRFLRGAGVPYYAMAAEQLIGVGRHPTLGDVCITYAITGGRPLEVFDIVYISSRDLHRWARGRNAEGVLCRDTAALRFDGWPRVEDGARIRLHEQPIGWLRGGGHPRRFCVLDWDCYEARELLAGIDAGQVRPVCDSVEHARRLARLVRPRKPKLGIEVAA